MIVDLGEFNSERLHFLHLLDHCVESLDVLIAGLPRVAGVTCLLDGVPLLVKVGDTRDEAHHRFLRRRREIGS